MMFLEGRRAGQCYDEVVAGLHVVDGITLAAAGSLERESKMPNRLGHASPGCKCCQMENVPIHLHEMRFVRMRTFC